MLSTPEYVVELRIDNQLVGDIRPYAQNLKWVRNRTRMGVDSISFTINDVILADWCHMRNTTIAELLRPIALDCRVIRNGVPVVGGFLASMPAYQPNGSTADLNLNFDGYLNLLDGIYLYPQATNHGKMGDLIKQWIEVANERSEAAGKSLGLISGNIDDMAVVDQSIDNYTTIKHIIANRCDNITGAGPFEVYIHPDRTYDVVKDENFGDEISDYVIQYPHELNGVSAVSLAASEVTGFASTIIGIGNGDVGSGELENPAPISIQTNSEAVAKYGYFETLMQNSSVSTPAVLARNVESELNNRSNMTWQPEIKLLGGVVNPVPTGKNKIWIGDTITIRNSSDYTEMTSGTFRVNTLSVDIDSTGAENITPTLSRGDAINTNSFFKDFVRLQNELLALKTGK